LGPGLVDLQINGCNGIDLNSPPLAPAEVGRMIRWLWSQGVTSSLPTIVTNSDEAIAQAMTAIVSARRNDPLVDSAIAGIHLEGPFISPEDGPRGAHPRRYVQAPDWERFARWQEAADGGITLITLSPEWPEAAAFIRRATAS